MIQSLLNFVKRRETVTYPPDVRALISQIVKEATHEKTGWYSTKLTDLSSYEKLKQADNDFKKQVLFCVIDNIIAYHKLTRGIWRIDQSYMERQVHETLMTTLLRSKLALNESDFNLMYKKFSIKAWQNYYFFLRWPIRLFLRQIKSFVEREGLSPALADLLQTMKKSKGLNGTGSYMSEKENEMKRKIDEILNIAGETEEQIILIKLDRKDKFGQLLHTFLHETQMPHQKHWNELFMLAAKSNGSKPSKRFLKQAEKLVEETGSEVYQTKLRAWFDYLVQLKTAEFTHTSRWGNYSTHVYLHPLNASIAKGLVWTTTLFEVSNFAGLLAALTERSFKKIPGVGPTAAALGNACVYALAQSDRIENISQLTRLQMRVQQNNTKKLIEKYISEAAQKLNISKEEIEDLAVPTLGLNDGIFTHKIEEFTAQIKITGIGKTKTEWIKADGKAQKSVPARVKQNHPDLVKTLSRTAKEIQKNLTAQRDRLDRSYLQNRKWKYADFKQHYLDHGLMSFLTKKLIWSFDNEQAQTHGIWLNNKWVDQQAQPILWIDDHTTVKLWHPIGESVETVTAWRAFLEAHEIKQPMKQAYREVYLLTDAERNTRTYSNRMAAHLLKQHQFNSLAKIRGWQYSLMGAYDDGRSNEAAYINIPNYGLIAEFWVNEVPEDEAYNDAGIWHYVATDQVRFLSDVPRDVLELEKIPPLVLSEVMRDVDLFVGVASVGNDPTWQDSGGVIQERFVDYWQTYSFGNLNETSKIRKEVLENLVPKLKIRNQCTIRENFLIVKGKLRTYKIHIGSTNILMEPNDSYLCIVVDRSTKTDNNVFLPFEGDRQLSIILSKAFLLAEDDKITDRTIISQISQRR